MTSVTQVLYEEQQQLRSTTSLVLSSDFTLVVSTEGDKRVVTERKGEFLWPRYIRVIHRELLILNRILYEQKIRVY